MTLANERLDLYRARGGLYRLHHGRRFVKLVRVVGPGKLEAVEFIDDIERKVYAAAGWSQRGPQIDPAPKPPPEEEPMSVVPALSESQIKSKLRRHLELLDAGKAAYKEADQVLTELLDAGAPVGEVIELSRDRRVVLKDLFAGRNSAVKVSFVRRYSVEDADKRRRA